MPLYRADFDVSGTLVFPRGIPPVVSCSESAGFEITFCNAAVDATGHVPGLDVRVVAMCGRLEDAPNAFREILAGQLDILTFVTQSTFKIEQCRRVVEWEPFQRTRVFKALQEFDPLYPPSPNLPVACVETAHVISQSAPEGYVLHAMHCFRNGVRSEQLADQFQNFWLAIETVAEGQKDRTKTAL